MHALANSEMHASKTHAHILEVSSAQSGQKLLALLERLLRLPKPILHKWIRTGQIRLNSKRCQPFERVKFQDIIRLPPFALSLGTENSTAVKQVLPLPQIIGEYNGLICYNKPAGLPTHAGSKHNDSLAARLKTAFADSTFTPVPVHRLDKDTSGVILVATTFSALRLAQDQLQQGKIIKEYLCWVEGLWPYSSSTILEDELQKLNMHGVEKMVVVNQKNEFSKTARLIVTPILSNGRASLLLVRILTGRTHQIRVQLANAKHSIIGDLKYGHIQNNGQLLLHAGRITLEDGHQFQALPPWQAQFQVDYIPSIDYAKQS